MHIQQLTIENFRNLATQTLNFHPQQNYISGCNGSGKTALLEALYSLGRGKSFRETQTRHIIAHQKDFYRLIAKIIDDKAEHLLGIERQTRDYRIRLDGENLSGLSALADLLPIQMLNSDHFALIDQGPEHRRRFTDYGLFYQDSRFLPAWQRYQYALKNRNAALRDNWPDEHIRPWHHQLSQTAQLIDQLRQIYLNDLEARLNYYHAELGGLETLNIRYHRGWAQDKTLEELLIQHLPRDRQLKHTRDGIHRAEWRIYAQEQDIAHYFSRGQQKTLLCALILAQNQVIQESSGKQPIILIDDITAELDPKRRELLLQFLTDSGAQLFITSIEALDTPKNRQHFFIQAGQLTPQS
ncbi:DNA replication/repair protein RecF [Suttonella ornithocola]|uniref:DNA replication and repair protein RecF n=1 Tax=Suttonella ornithocola TaxID=279832 RepID=A0A380MV88_9GAMM|nr:DNA replication/repair protein RecF [Suttonella ornithocola]SUO95833.1 DNA replication and repair protein recF [Suttonella ornithocola]